MKLKSLSFFSFFASMCTLSQIVFSQVIGIADVMKNANVQDEDGFTLASYIQPFKYYDLRNQDEIKNSEKVIRVVVVGCVGFPGVYAIKSGTGFSQLLEKASPISRKNCPTGAYTRKVEFYRINQEMRYLDAENKDHAELLLLDGDVINVRSVTL
jgi:hypothetical protein